MVQVEEEEESLTAVVAAVVGRGHLSRPARPAASLGTHVKEEGGERAFMGEKQVTFVFFSLFSNPTARRANRRAPFSDILFVNKARTASEIRGIEEEEDDEALVMVTVRVLVLLLQDEEGREEKEEALLAVAPRLCAVLHGNRDEKEDWVDGEDKNNNAVVVVVDVMTPLVLFPLDLNGEGREELKDDDGEEYRGKTASVSFGEGVVSADFLLLPLHLMFSSLCCFTFPPPLIIPTCSSLLSLLSLSSISLRLVGTEKEDEEKNGASLSSSFSSFFSSSLSSLLSLDPSL